MENGDGVLAHGRDKETEVLQGPISEECLATLQGFGLSVATTRTFKLREIHVVHGLQQKMDTPEQAALLSSCGKDLDSSPAEGMPDIEWKTATRRRLRLFL